MAPNETSAFTVEGFQVETRKGFPPLLSKLSLYFEKLVFLPAPQGRYFWRLPEHNAFPALRLNRLAPSENWDTADFESIPQKLTAAKGYVVDVWLALIWRFFRQVSNDILRMPPVSDTPLKVGQSLYEK